MPEHAPEPDAETPEVEDDLVRAVKACQLTVCTEVVPEALAIRVAAAREAQAAGVRWFRTAAAHDLRVVELEAPYRRILQSATAPDPAPVKPRRRARTTPQTSGSRGRRGTKIEGK